MKAKQFINYCLTEYEDLSKEKENIIRTISGLDAGDENQAALLDRIWKLLNSETFGSNITNAFVTTTKDEYMQATTLEGHQVADDLTIVDTSGSGTAGITIRSDNDKAGRIYFSDAESGDGEYRGFINYYHQIIYR